MTRILLLSLLLTLGVAGTVAAHDTPAPKPAATAPGPVVAQVPDTGLFKSAHGDAVISRVQTKAADPLPPEVFRRRVVAADLTYLQAKVMPRVAPADAGSAKRVETSGDAVRFNLFADVIVDAVIESFQHTQSGDLVWQGRLADGKDGSVHLVIAKGRITGSVIAGGMTYAIFPDKQGNTVIDQIDPGGFPKAGPHPIPEIPKGEKRGDLPFWQAPADGPSIVGDPNSMTIVTLLAAYTDAAAAESADIQSEINLAVSMANTSFANSGINITLQLVGTIAATYVEAGRSASTVINDARLGMAGSGELSELYSARRTFGADLVALIVRNYSAFQACGIAYMPLNPTVAYAQYGVSASMRGSCITGNQTLAHEIGHNMGVAHDRYAVRAYNEGPWYGTLPQDYDYFGYVDTGAREMDVMSYFDACSAAGVSCTRATRFSNPSRTFTNGSPSGIALGQTDPANNARVLNINKDVVAQWRPTTATGISLTVVKSGTGSGTVISSPDGINCGSTCSASFTAGQAVVLTAAAASGSTFVGWSGSCSGTSAATTVTLSASASCGAAFTATTTVTRPANDALSAATTISGTSGSTTGTSVNATKETGEANHAGNSGGKSVWWTWSPTGTGSATITTIGSSFDTLLAIYTGTSVASLTAVASNDDISTSTLQSSVTFTATAGQTYQIAVDGYSAASGSIALNWTQTVGTSGPANNAFSSAIALTSASGTTSGSNASATKETGEPRHAGNGGGASVWWKITPTAAGHVTVNTAGSSFDTLLAVYTGASVSQLTTVASSDDTGATLQSAVSFTATAGTTYYVAVDGYNGATGSIVLAYTGGPTASFTAQAGWWWAPTAPGTALGIEQSGANLFVSAYFYDTDGTAVWYAAMGAISGSTFSGSLVEYSGGQTLSGSYQAPAVRRIVGTLTILFTSATAATVSWPGGTTQAIERFNIVSGGVAAGSATGDPEKGWWWSSSESGRGYFLETQGSARSLYMASYMYDADGSAVWYVASGTLQAGVFGVGSTYTGYLVEYSGGQTLGGTWQSPSLAGLRGAITVEFTGSTQATLTLPSGAQVALTRFTF